MSSRVIVVTGASSGIGFEIANKLQELGDHVIWCSRSIENNENIQGLIQSNSSIMNVDVSNEESVIKLFSFVNEKYGRLDALINCAGFVIPQSLLMTTLSNWKETIDINLTGTFLCCKHGLNIMKKTGGRIINIASTAGLTPRPGWSAYAAAKSGVINFSHAISEELNEYGIKVFVLCPGRTATPLRKILAPTEDPSTIMQPDVVADMAIFCLSKQADALEGQPILVRERF